MEQSTTCKTYKIDIMGCRHFIIWRVRKGVTVGFAVLFLGPRSDRAVKKEEECMTSGIEE